MSRRCSVGKRSSFERRERDFYPTPLEAVLPLLPHLPTTVAFAEPCAGDGSLIRHLESFGHRCGFASDIEPLDDEIECRDAMTINRQDLGLSWSVIITNPPWSRDVLHPMITHLSRLGPTWLLFDADWLHTRQSAPYLRILHKVVSVGRVKWIPDSKMTGKDNCAWYLFDARPAENTLFFGRTERLAA